MAKACSPAEQVEAAESWPLCQFCAEPYLQGSLTNVDFAFLAPLYKKGTRKKLA